MQFEEKTVENKSAMMITVLKLLMKITFSQKRNAVGKGFSRYNANFFFFFRCNIPVNVISCPLFVLNYTTNNLKKKKKLHLQKLIWKCIN